MADKKVTDLLVDVFVEAGAERISSCGIRKREVVPIVVTMLLGFIAAWHHDFDEKQASTLNRMVLLYAVRWVSSPARLTRGATY